MKDKKSILESLANSPIILSELIQSIPSQFLKIKRGEKFWTIEEHAIHLAQVQPMLLDRLSRFTEEEQPEFIPFIPENEDSDQKLEHNDMDLENALYFFESFRKKQLSFINSVSPDVWLKKAIHPEYTQYSFYILVRHILMHDHWHMYRIEELWLTKDKYLTFLEG